METQELWQAALAKLELNMSRPTFLTWFQETGIINLESGVATIYVPNGFAKEWLQNKYHKNILHVLRELNPAIKDLAYIISRPNCAKISGKPAEIQRARKIRETIKIQENSADESAIKELMVNPQTNLNPRYSFQNFVVGSFNELAHAAAQSVIKNPGTNYNPLFIYGGVGLGKTHLVQAIGNELLQINPDFRIRYVPSEKYMGEIVEALRNQEMNKLKEKYRSVDVLIMDDIQFIARTEKMQEEFFHTFNALYENNKQIVISSDKPPQAISTLENRLRSRFEGGMIADIGMPDLETRLLILKTKADAKKINVPEEALRYIAENVKSNIRELEGSLNKVIINAKLASAPLDMETVKKILSGRKQSAAKFISPKKIIKTVCEFYDLEEKNILTHSRRQDIVKPRQIAMYLMREELKLSYPSIGEKFGGRDHTTAIHSCDKIVEELKVNGELDEQIKIIKEKIYSV